MKLKVVYCIDANMELLIGVSNGDDTKSII